ncbi:hypothetical protein ABPG72_002273 [Tetrahymena utriculariae]
MANYASNNPLKKSQGVNYQQNVLQTNHSQQDQQSFYNKNANHSDNNYHGNHFQQNYKNNNLQQQGINNQQIIDQKQRDIHTGQGEETREKENEITKYQYKEIKKKMIQRSQDQIIDEIYKHQKQLVMKEAIDKLDKENPQQNNEQNCSQIIQQNSVDDQDKFSYSVNNGQAINYQRQQKQDILRMLNPPNYLKQKWNIIQKGIEDRLITHNEDGLPKNINPIEKSILQEKENGYKLLKPEDEIGELVQQEEDEENMSNEVLIARKIVKILEEFKEVQKRDQDSIFHIALKQYCEKFHKNYDCVFTEEKDLKLKGFVCEVIVDGIRLGPQLAKSKKDAKTQACMCAMARIMQQAPNMKPIEYFQKFLEQSKNKYIRLNENIAEAISQHHQQGGIPLSADNPLSDLAIAQEIPENSNYREELSIFAHKNLHKQIIWETLFDPKEKLWLAIVAVGNLSERGFGRSKKYAKNVASYKLLQRCKQLKMKDDIFKNPRKVKTQLQFALNLEQNEDDEFNKQQNSLIKVKPSGKQNDQINSKRSRSQVDEQVNDLDYLDDEEEESEPDLKKKKQSQQQQQQQQQQQLNTKSIAHIKMKEFIISLEEKYIDYYKLELSNNLNQSKLNNSSNTDVFKQILKYDSEIQATKAQYQSLQNMFNEVQKKLLIDQQSQYIKKLIPIGSYVSNCMNKYSTVIDVVAILMPSQEQGENFEPSRFCDILYTEVQSTILNSNIGYFFKMELNKGCVLLVFTHNSQYKIRLIPNLVLEENILNKRKFLQIAENPLNDSVRSIIDPNESQFYSDSLLHYIWLSQYKAQIHQYESLFRVLRRVFKYQGFKIPIDLIDVVVGHISHQFSSPSFQENLVGFVKFMAQNGLDDITHDNLQMVSITQLHINQIKNCSEFELKKIQEYFNNIYTKKGYENLIII